MPKLKHFKLHLSKFDMIERARLENTLEHSFKKIDYNKIRQITGINLSNEKIQQLLFNIIARDLASKKVDFAITKKVFQLLPKIIDRYKYRLEIKSFLNSLRKTVMRYAIAFILGITIPTSVATSAVAKERIEEIKTKKPINRTQEQKEAIKEIYNEVEKKIKDSEYKEYIFYHLNNIFSKDVDDKIIKFVSNLVLISKNKQILENELALLQKLLKKGLSEENINLLFSIFYFIKDEYVLSFLIEFNNLLAKKGHKYDSYLNKILKNVPIEHKANVVWALRTGFLEKYGEKEFDEMVKYVISNYKSDVFFVLKELAKTERYIQWKRFLKNYVIDDPYYILMLREVLSDEMSRDLFFSIKDEEVRKVYVQNFNKFNSTVYNENVKEIFLRVKIRQKDAIETMATYLINIFARTWKQVLEDILKYESKYHKYLYKIYRNYAHYDPGDIAKKIAFVFKNSKNIEDSLDLLSYMPYEKFATDEKHVKDFRTIRYNVLKYKVREDDLATAIRFYAAYPKEFKVLFERNNIRFWSRYSPDFLLDVAQNMLDKNRLKNEPLTVILYNQYDHNGAFYNNTFLDDIIKHNHKVLLFETDNEISFQEYINYAVKIQGRLIDNLIIGGHGSPKAIDLGKGKDEKYKLDLTDDDILKGVTYRIKDKAKIILVACSTGKTENSIANKIAKSFSKKVTVFAPSDTTTIPKIIWQGNKIKEIKYEYAKTKEFSSNKK